MKPSSMTHHPVTSSNIASIGYDAARQAMQVQFKSGGLYEYDNVPEGEYSALMAAKSKGGHLHKHIVGRHKFKKIG